VSARYRACLYVGADREDLVDLVQAARVDVVLVDLEDAVAADRKRIGRERAAALLDAAPGCDVLVRTNALDSPEVDDDLALCRAGLAAFVAPMLRQVGDVQEMDRRIARAEAAAGLDAGRIGLVPMLETPRAVLKAIDLLEASPRVRGAVFGPNDYTAETGAGLISGGGFAYPADVGVAHALVVAAARAAGVWCMTPTLNRLGDLTELGRQARALYARGYDGVIVVEPKQVPVLREAVHPCAEDLAFAQGIVGAFDAASVTGTPRSHDGWFVYDGPFLATARAVVAAARSDG
jgi:citrate lyase subunit beta/citryl-CoA lyase